MPTGILVLTDCVLTLGGTAVTTKASKVELPVEVDELDVTVFGGQWKKRTGGLLDAKLNAAFFNEYAGGDLDELTWNWIIGRVPIPFTVKPTSAATGPTNPQWGGLVLPKSYAPISGDVGSVNKFDISWPTSGAVARAVA
ncbi:hypothetical protein [Actinoplanes sp. NPDC026623]|uniref:hypothetical protein n=1 Tax=Actinoplanes sp. NPDC026623 TaxID=3155610 RepID=UPI0033C9822A